jgi:peptidoglycan/xylan/chitin deacetylase (PgdA/CDA1 family)
MNRGVKAAFLAVARVAGMNRAVAASPWRRDRLLILCYHGIALADEHLWDPTLCMAPDRFERRLRLLERNRCTVLPLGEAVERLYRRALPDRAVCLTFDDGYYDFVAQAHPRLQRSGLPSTVYLNTLRCGHDYPIVRIALSYVLWKSGRDSLHGSGLPGLADRPYAVRTRDERWAVAVTVHDTLLAADADLASQDDVLRQVADRVGVDLDAIRRSRALALMRPSEVAALAAGGVDFQLHTHRHRTPSDEALFLDEIRENRFRIQAITGVRPTHFCYPSGVHRPSYLPLLEAEGVVSATTTRAGIAGPADPPLLLPRFVDTNAVSEAEFEAWLTGTAPRLREMRPRRRTAASQPAAASGGGPAGR